MTMPFSVAGKHVVVMGAGRSGRAAASLLVSKGARVTLADSDPARISLAGELDREHVAFEFGPHRAALLLTSDLVVLSPGVAATDEAVTAAARAGIPVIGEVELASRWLKGRTVAVTGTKGKSTTTTLTARIIAEA
jgi:UDP-N-acetylmuramoylalanine--D-glutamate ligase